MTYPTGGSGSFDPRVKVRVVFTTPGKDLWDEANYKAEVSLSHITKETVYEMDLGVYCALLNNKMNAVEYYVKSFHWMYGSPTLTNPPAAPEASAPTPEPVTVDEETLDLFIGAFDAAQNWGFYLFQSGDYNTPLDPTMANAAHRDQLRNIVQAFLQDEVHRRVTKDGVQLIAKPTLPSKVELMKWLSEERMYKFLASLQGSPQWCVQIAKNLPNGTTTFVDWHKTINPAAMGEMRNVIINSLYPEK